DVVARALATLGVDLVFGVTGGFPMTTGGTRFIAAGHEDAAAVMAGAYARMSGKVGVVSMPRGSEPTGVAETGSPLIVLVNGATSEFHHEAVTKRSAAETVAEAYATALRDQRAVLLDMRAPLADGPPAMPLRQARVWPYGGAEALAWMLMRSGKPVFIAGRGARRARRELEELADLVGALLATSTAAKGLFRGNPWDLDVSGVFSTPLTARLIRGADIVVAWGCSLDPRATRHGTLLGPGVEVVQIDLDEESIGTHRRVSLGLVGDIPEAAGAVADVLRPAGSRPSPAPRGYRTRVPAGRIAAERDWRCVPYEDTSGNGRIDPRTLTIALDDLLPKERIVAPDTGNSARYPAMLLDVPDEGGFCFPQGSQPTGLATTIGAALARPDRLPIAALGDVGGALTDIAELATVIRLALPMVIVLYDDGTHDTAPIAPEYGCAAVTVTAVPDRRRRDHLAERPPRPPAAHPRQSHSRPCRRVAGGGMEVRGMNPMDGGGLRAVVLPDIDHLVKKSVTHFPSGRCSWVGAPPWPA
ncbi:thiamine pyrophosphate-binding protein, partial [Sinosporangium siamense]